LQVEGRAVGVAVQIAERRRDRGEGLGRRAERVLVRRELDRAVDAELALELLDRHPGGIRGERPEPVRNEAAQIHGFTSPGRGRIGAEQLQPERAALDLRQRPLHATLLAMPLQIQEEEVLPGTTAERTRLDLDQIDAMSRERAAHAEEDADLVAHAEEDRGLV